jgi:phosphate-selective porin OprO/OprP
MFLSVFAALPTLRRAVAGILVVVSAMLLVPPALAQEQEGTPLEIRVLQLEQQVRQLEALQQTPSGPETLPAPRVDPKASDAASQTKSDGKSEGSSNPVAGWKDGFFIQSTDKQYILKLTGQIQADYRAFLNSADTTDLDTFFLRRARFGLEATVFDAWEFRFLPDFGQGQTHIQDSYLNVHYVDWLQLTVGKFKQPVSYEELIQDRFVPTLERSIIDQIMPARDVGVMLHGQKLFGDRFEYAASLSNGEINGDANLNDQLDFDARVAVRPFDHTSFWEGLWLLQFGVSGSFGNENETVNPQTLKTSAGVPWLTYNSTVHAEGIRTRITPEVSYFYHGLGMAAQYVRMEQELRPNTSGPTYPFLTSVPTEGFYVLATYLLTGEERTTYSAAVDPLLPFDPFNPFSSPGAWELVAQVSRLNVDPEIFVPGKANLADPAKYSHAATELTLGFNWYFNKLARLQFNWEHSWFDDPVLLGTGPGGRIKEQDSLMTRFQIIF